MYPNIPSALRPVPYGEGIYVPKPPKEFTIDSDDEDEDESTSGSPESPASTEPHVSHCRSSTPQPHILTQDVLNNRVRDLELSNSKAELLGSRLKTKESSRVKCPNFFVSQSSSAFGAFLQKGRWPCVLLRCRWPVEYPRNQTWPARMTSIDSSKLSLKAVLLHNGNHHPSIPVRRKPKAAAEKAWIQQVWLAYLWWPEGSASVDGSPTGIYEVLLFFLWMGQSSKGFALPEERLASEGISEGRREECATPSSGRMTPNPATAPTHQTRSDEKLRKSHGPDWIGFKVYGWKIPSTQQSEN